eukprot:1483818-Pyramimonas_sp.AAC.1
MDNESRSHVHSGLQVTPREWATTGRAPGRPSVQRPKHCRGEPLHVDMPGSAPAQRRRAPPRQPRALLPYQ